MFTWLSTLAIPFQVFFVVLFLVCVLVVAILAIRKGVSFTKGKDGYGVHIGSQKKKKTPSNPHSECPNVKDVLVMMNEVVRLTNERFHLIEKAKTKSQMNYADQKVEQIRSMLLKSYIDLYNKKKGDGSPDDKSVQIYRLILKDVQNNIRTILRSAFIDNGFDKMNEREFDDYCEEKFNFIVSQFLEYISDNYFYDSFISLEKLKKTFQDVDHKIRDMFDDIFTNARDVAIDTNLKALEIDERIERVIKQSIGISCLMPSNRKDDIA